MGGADAGAGGGGRWGRKGKGEFGPAGPGSKGSGLAGFGGSLANGGGSGGGVTVGVSDDTPVGGLGDDKVGGPKVASGAEVEAMWSRAGAGKATRIGKTAPGLVGSAAGGVATLLGASNPVSFGLGAAGDLLGWFRGDENVIEVGDFLPDAGKPVDQPVSERTAVQTISLADPTYPTVDMSTAKPGEASRPHVDVRSLPSAIGPQKGTPFMSAFSEDREGQSPASVAGDFGGDFDGNGGETPSVSAAEEGPPSTLPKEDTGVTSPATVSDAVAKAERNRRTRARARRATSFETLMGT